MWSENATSMHFSRNMSASLMRTLLKLVDSFSRDEPTSRSEDPGKRYAFRVNGCNAILGYVITRYRWKNPVVPCLVNQSPPANCNFGYASYGNSRYALSSA